MPEEAKAKAQELREEQDFLGRFLDERMEKTENPAEMVLVSKLYETFQRHAETTGEGSTGRARSSTQRCVPRDTKTARSPYTAREKRAASVRREAVEQLYRRVVRDGGRGSFIRFGAIPDAIWLL